MTIAEAMSNLVFAPISDIKVQILNYSLYFNMLDRIFSHFKLFSTIRM